MREATMETNVVYLVSTAIKIFIETISRAASGNFRADQKDETPHTTYPAHY